MLNILTNLEISDIFFKNFNTYVQFVDITEQCYIEYVPNKILKFVHKIRD